MRVGFRGRFAFLLTRLGGENNNGCVSTAPSRRASRELLQNLPDRNAAVANAFHVIFNNKNNTELKAGSKYY